MAAGAGIAVTIIILFLMQMDKQVPRLLRHLGAEPGQGWCDLDSQATADCFWDVGAGVGVLIILVPRAWAERRGQGM